jgi:hypothetical protein
MKVTPHILAVPFEVNQVSVVLNWFEELRRRRCNICTNMPCSQRRVFAFRSN